MILYAILFVIIFYAVHFFIERIFIRIYKETYNDNDPDKKFRYLDLWSKLDFLLRIFYIVSLVLIYYLSRRLF
jgi:hypothetical protein